MAKRSEHFSVEEFFPPSMLLKYSEDRLWSLLDDRIVWTADQLRERFGRAVINNAPFGGQNQFRGFRPFDCETGAELSQHKFGRAIDITFEDYDVAYVRQDIKDHHALDRYKHITYVEEDVPWLHIDCRFSIRGSIHFFKP